MTDAPERIFLSPEDAGQFNKKYGHESLDLVCVGDPYVEYIRADIHAALVKAADEVARLLNDEADCYAEFDTGRIEMKKALTAYQQAKEKLDA